MSHTLDAGTPSRMVHHTASHSSCLMHSAQRGIAIRPEREDACTTPVASDPKHKVSPDSRGDDRGHAMHATPPPRGWQGRDSISWLMTLAREAAVLAASTSASPLDLPDASWRHQWPSFSLRGAYAIIYSCGGSTGFTPVSCIATRCARGTSMRGATMANKKRRARLS